MDNIKIIRDGNKIKVISYFTNQVFKGEFKNGRLVTKKPLDLRMIQKALELESKSN